MKKAPTKPKAKKKAKKLPPPPSETTLLSPPKVTGRKSTVTPEATAKLREVFLLDYDVLEACDYAGISDDAYYRRYKKDKVFRGDMDEAQRGLFKSAKTVVATEIIVKKNARVALDVLKHRQPHRYRTKVDLGTGDDEHGRSVLPAGTIIVLPGSRPHPRIVPEPPTPKQDAEEDD